MTDRVVAYLVTLGRDVREDDAEVITSALRMVKGVVSVEPLKEEWAVQVAKVRADVEWQERILAMLKEAR